MALLEVKELVKTYGGRAVLDGVSPYPSVSELVDAPNCLV